MCVPLQDKGLVDQTRGILTWVSENCPDNFHQHLAYVTVGNPPPKHTMLALHALGLLRGC